MGRNFKATPGQFLDFVYQPNYELEMAKAQQDVEADALNKAFASAAEFQAGPTFQGWKPAMDEQVSFLNEKVNPFVEALMTDPNDKKALRGIHDLSKKARELYSSGDIGKMMHHYKTYNEHIAELEEELKNTKNPELRADIRARINTYKHTITSQVAKGYTSDFNLERMSPHIDVQQHLKDTIDAENLEYSFSSYGNLKPLPGLNYKHSMDKYTQEGYNVGMLQAAAQNTIQTSQAFHDMVQQDWELFGRGEGMEFEDYKEQRMVQELQTYMAQYPEITKTDIDRTVVTDNYGLAKAKGEIVPSQFLTFGKDYHILPKEDREAGGKMWKDFLVTDRVNGSQFHYLDNIYSKGLEEKADDIIVAAGVDLESVPESMRYQTALDIIKTELPKLTDDKPDVKKEQKGGQNTVQAFPVHTDRSEYNRLVKINDTLNDIIDYTNKHMAGAKITRSFMPADKLTQEGIVGLSIVEQALNSGITPIHVPIDRLPFDEEGDLRDNIRIDVDNSVFRTGENQGQVMPMLLAKTGTTSAEQILEQELGDFKWRVQEGVLIIDFVPNNSNLKAKGIDITDKYWNQGGFTMLYENVDMRTLVQSLSSDSQEAFTILRNADVTFGEAANAVDKAIAKIDARGGEKTENITLFGNNYQIKRNKSKGTWELHTEGGLIDETFYPDAISLYLTQLRQNSK